jgi:hypothetical protein
VKGLLIALVFSLTACSPTPVPSPSSSTVAVLPEPSCGPARSPLASYAIPTCEQAVDAAIKVVPANHPPITAIEFHYGFYCPGSSCPSQDRIGYVVFTTEGGRQWWVIVALDSKDHLVTDMSEWQPFPPVASPAL